MWDPAHSRRPGNSWRSSQTPSCPQFCLCDDAGPGRGFNLVETISTWHKAKIRCPNCVRNLPRGLRQLDEGVLWLRNVAQLLVAGQQVFRCLYCSFVWRQSVGPLARIKVTPLGLYRSDSNRLQRLPTGFKPALLEPEQVRPLPPLPGMKSLDRRGRSNKRNQR